MEMFIWGTFFWFVLLAIPGSFAVSFVQSRKTTSRAPSARAGVSLAFLVSALLASCYFLLGISGTLSWGEMDLLECLPATLSVGLAYSFMAVVNHHLISRGSGSIVLLGPVVMAFTASLLFCASVSIVQTLSAP